MISFRQLALVLALILVSSLGLRVAYSQQQLSVLTEDDLQALYDEAVNQQDAAVAEQQQLLHIDELAARQADGGQDRRALGDAFESALADRLLKARWQQQQLPLGMDGASPLLEPPQMAGPMKRRQDSPSPGYYFYDVNSHLPAAAAASELQAAPSGAPPLDQDQTLSAPANDPEEFEARLSELTNGLNHNMANTLERQQLLMGLMNRSSENEQTSDLNSLDNFEKDRLLSELAKLLADQVRDKQQQQQQQQQQQDPDDSEFETTTLARYGGSEYIDHPLALAGHQYVQGGAGEGRQLLGPDGTFENVQVIKTDSAIPSYCDPPNPCPIGYTAQDGCLEDFVNSASFSREYQAQQKCSCDNEHSLFNCAAPSSSAASSTSTSSSPTFEDSQQQADELAKESDDDAKRPTFEAASKLDTLARTIQTRFGDLASVQKLIGKQQQASPGDDFNGLAGNDDQDSNYLVRSARKLSSLDMHHKVNLD